MREFQYSRLSETALLSAGSCLRSAAHGWNPEASPYQEGQNAQVSANWPFFRILAQSPIWAKRLEEGTYAMPSAADAMDRRREITTQELAALLSGIDLQQASRRKRYRR